jgi:Sigma-70, region 4
MLNIEEKPEQIQGDVDMSFEEIGRRLGMSRSRAYQIYKAAMPKLQHKRRTIQLQNLKELAQRKRMYDSGPPAVCAKVASQNR